MTLLEKYYNKFKEENRLKTRHGIVEFTTSMKYIHKYLNSFQKKNNLQKNQIKILDLGAATGNYSVPLSQEGYDVTAVELVKHNLDILRSKHQNVKTWQGNALDLHFLQDNTFNFCICFGPMYHLTCQKEQLQAFKEVCRVTKKDGIIFVAYIMNEYAIINYCFGENKINECIKNGKLTKDFHTIVNQDDLYNYMRLEDINSLNKITGLKRLKIFSQEGASDYIRPLLNSMDNKTFESFINYHLATCERKELLGAASHLVDVLLNN